MTGPTDRPPLSLPNPAAVRARIAALDAETSALRRLLRLLLQLSPPIR